MNKKQFAITMLLLLLMGCVALGQRFFGDKMVNLAIDETKYKSYSIYDGKYIYSLPEDWTVEQKKYPGNFIVYHNEFKCDSKGIRGDIQLLESTESIDEICKRNIKIIKDNKSNENLIKGNFKTEKYSGDGIEYNFKSSTGKVYAIKEYIFKLSDKYMVKYKFVIDKERVIKDMEKEFFDTIDKFEEK